MRWCGVLWMCCAVLCCAVLCCAVLCGQTVDGKKVTEVMNGSLSLVDLAGNEKLKDSNAEGKTQQETRVRRLRPRLATAQHSTAPASALQYPTLHGDAAKKEQTPCCYHAQQSHPLPCQSQTP